MPHFPDKQWSAICKKTNERFDFDDYFYEGEPFHSPQVYVYRTMKFPKGDGQQVQVQCAKCKETHLYERDELLAPVSIVEADQKEIEDRAKLALVDIKREDREHEKEMKGFERRIKELEGMVKEKDKLLTGKVNDLAEAYLSLAKFAHEEVPKLVQQAKSKKVSYEAPSG